MPGLKLLEALTTPHGLDRYLELVNPMLTVRELRARVTDVHRSTSDTVTLTLRPTRQWRGFKAGQFVKVTVTIDGVRRTRCYSPSCSQYRADGKIELTIKAHPEGLVSQYLHRAARPGLVIGLSPADGTFSLPDTRSDPLVLISGGSGITPVLSMLRTLVDEGHAGEVVFLHYAYTEHDVPLKREIERLAEGRPNIRLAFAYTDAPGTGDLNGFFSVKHLRAVAPRFAEAQTYLCGPPGLMKSVRQRYKQAGVSERLHTEDFAPAPVAAVGTAGGTIHFGRSGTSATNTGASLLEQAEAAGLTPEHGCRMGVCFSCTQIKKTGCVQNLLNGSTSSEEDEEIQLCINTPVGDVTIEI
ncbi:ferredoxin-NADP reductase [Herbihabitans rhizosphaerae]|uniref:Ferredoxin-NADP reductase n=1 Tax=Herbihabitans rhizosphaerae TaxID=1872711 RepID=A0A4Q7KQU7_9PSEU|nr:FAD-binding oxidoreductase [Herbihabitans rhizosphaerae]RZS38807.1 ferredoxin-NADP reductase [Herbihabitans rhizosphaerae]